MILHQNFLIKKGKKDPTFRSVNLKLRQNRGIRKPKALTLTFPKTNIIPIWHLMLIHTDRPGTSIGTGIHLGDTANGDARIGCRVFRDRTNFLQHPFGSADPLANKGVSVVFIFAASLNLWVLFFASLLLHPNGLPCYHSWYRCPQ